MTIDWQLLWHMDGHGAYVWGSYGMALALVAAEAMALWTRRRTNRLMHAHVAQVDHAAHEKESA